METPKDRIADGAQGCDVAFKLADNIDGLNTASSHDLVAAAALLTRLIIRASRFGTSEQARFDDMPRMMAARQTITAEIRRRLSAVPTVG